MARQPRKQNGAKKVQSTTIAAEAPTELSESILEQPIAQDTEQEKTPENATQEVLEASKQPTKQKEEIFSPKLIKKAYLPEIVDAILEEGKKHNIKNDKSYRHNIEGYPYVVKILVGDGEKRKVDPKETPTSKEIVTDTGVQLVDELIKYANMGMKRHPQAMVRNNPYEVTLIRGTEA